MVTAINTPSIPSRPCFLRYPSQFLRPFVITSVSRVHLVRKDMGLGLFLGKKMGSLRFLEQGLVPYCCCVNGDRELEAEILEFMEKSGKPDAFPTRKELERSGRFDLVEAIKKRGGWYSFGWEWEEVEVGPTKPRIEELSGIVEKEYYESGSLRHGEEEYSGGDFELGSSSCQQASSSGRSIEAAVEKYSGIEGILNRLEKERISSLGINTGKYGYGENFSRRDNMTRISSGTTTTDSTDLGKNGGLTRGSPVKDSLSDSGGQLNVEFTPDMWRTWSAQRAGSLITEFEAGEISGYERPSGGKIDSARDDQNSFRENSDEALERWKSKSNTDIKTRLRELEMELSSTLHSLRSNSENFSSKEVLGRSSSELGKIADAWEFQENEVIRAREKLRSIRAKIAILEGRMALALIDAQKVMDVKQKRIDGARKALQFLRATQIIWHNPASEVLVTGSFDGWTTQRRMEKTEAGIFTVSLKLYPGRYEIKFIVDGIWKVDPLRPIVHNNGYENNLFIVT